MGYHFARRLINLHYARGESDAVGKERHRQQVRTGSRQGRDSANGGFMRLILSDVKCSRYGFEKNPPGSTTCLACGCDLANQSTLGPPQQSVLPATAAPAPAVARMPTAPPSGSTSCSPPTIPIVIQRRSL